MAPVRPITMWRTASAAARGVLRPIPSARGSTHVCWFCGVAYASPMLCECGLNRRRSLTCPLVQLRPLGGAAHCQCDGVTTDTEAQHTRELTSLLEASRAASSTLEIEALLDVLLDRLKTVVEYRVATVCTRADDDGPN